MDEDHRRDMTDGNRMHDLRFHIAAFLANPPSRASRQTREALTLAMVALLADEDQIVAAWD